MTCVDNSLHPRFDTSIFIAKSLLCVQNIAKIPLLPRFNGRTTSNPISSTEKNTTDFEMKIAKRNLQFTVSHLTSDSERKIREGNANVPT